LPGTSEGLRPWLGAPGPRRKRVADLRWGASDGGESLQQRLPEGGFGAALSVDEDHFAGRGCHGADEIEEVLLVGMGRITAERMDPRADVVPSAIELDIPATRTIPLDRQPRRADGPVPDKEDIISRVAEHRLEVIDDTPARAHPAGRYHDRRPMLARRKLRDAPEGGTARSCFFS
jgi:hypothetical protein